jgi:simple sugar transport system substrate-binding protein
MGQSGEIVANLTGAYYVGHPNTKALMGTSGNAWGIGSFIKSQGLAGKVVGGGWDLTPECLQYISDGVMSYTVDQKPYFQGFYPVYEIWKFITSGGAYSPCGVNTGGGIVDSSNVAAILKNRPTG